MTPQESSDRKKKTFESTVMRNCLNGVLGAGRMVATVTDHHWTDGVLVKTDRQKQQLAH
jgi:hypothetical protein